MEAGPGRPAGNLHERQTGNELEWAPLRAHRAGQEGGEEGAAAAAAAGERRRTPGKVWCRGPQALKAAPGRAERGRAEPGHRGRALCRRRPSGACAAWSGAEQGAAGRCRASQHVLHPAVHPSHRQAAPGLEERGAERAGGEMVREGGEEPGEEAEEDGAAGRAGEGDHHAEHQHQVHHHPQVKGGGRAWRRAPGACGVLPRARGWPERGSRGPAAPPPGAALGPVLPRGLGPGSIYSVKGEKKNKNQAAELDCCRVTRGEESERGMQGGGIRLQPRFQKKKKLDALWITVLLSVDALIVRKFQRVL